MVIHRGMRRSFFGAIKPSPSLKRRTGADASDEARELEALFWDAVDDYLHPKR